MSGFSTFAAAYLAFLMTRDPNGFRDFVKTRNPSDLHSSYDFIIVGAGSAGSALANRLSENSKWKILLLEAGGQENYFSRTPAMLSALVGSLQPDLDWNYTTTKQTRTCLRSNGMCPYPRGRALGGSSSINGMIFVRGYRSDYDRWGEENPGWNFKDVLPYFIRSEGNRIPGLVCHGRTGPVTVDSASDNDKIKAALLKGGGEMGWKNGDCQQNEESCIENTQNSIRDGRRCSASTAYLEPISRDRENLHILTGAAVDKILIENKTATGVQFTVNNHSYRAGVSKEVILSAGAINSPKILMLSGIGLRDHLQAVGIPIVADLPVGNNLQDHVGVTMRFQVKNASTTTLDEIVDGQETYAGNQTGPLATNGVALLAWNKLREGPPIVQYHVKTNSLDNNDSVFIITNVARPRTRGTLRLDLKNPNGQPLIDVNYLDHPVDRKLTSEGLIDAMKFMETSALRAYDPKLLPPPQCNDTFSSREQLVDCLIKYNSLPICHAVGTVKMGPTSGGGVVSNELKVHGVQQLRVVDASIAPSLVSMNTNPMAIMIGEKGSDIIKKEYLATNAKQ